jgi:small subunit ribosomal protein S8
MSRDSIGDFLTIVRNGIRIAKPWIVAPHSIMNEQIAKVLKEKGFIKDVAVVQDEGAHKQLKVVLKYVDGESVIHEINRVSTPGRRTFAGAKTIKPVIGGLGITIVTTSKGIMTNDQAKAANVGGEVICTVW